MMNVLVVGSGGREHALCWKIRESKLVDKLFCAPGNAGISQVAECVAIGAMEFEKLVEFAKENNKLIIEDDYGSEFRYLNRPTPSLQGLAGGENVVYLGTFSKLLLPSIRISFMILPDSFLKEYNHKRYRKTT